MRMRKRALSLLCIVALILSMGGGAFAAEADDVVFSEDGATLISYPASRTDASYTVPSDVKAIGDNAFLGSKLTSITLPEGLTTIGHQAFSSASLTTINLPSTVTSVGISNTLDRADAFWSCTNLSSVTIAMKQVPKALFAGRAALEVVTFADTVEAIGDEAFENCDALTTVTLPSSVTTIGRSAFYHCSALTSVTLNEGLQDIGEKAFEECGRLSFPTLPASLTDIGPYAFAGLPLTAVTPNMFPATLTALPDGVFSSCESLLTVELPSTITSLGQSAFSHCDALTNVIIPDIITAIEDYTFTGCAALTDVNLGDNITTIGTSAFSNCDSLRTLTLPSKLTSLGRSAFNSCDVLESIDLPDGVKQIGSYAFENCVALTSVDLPNTLESVDAGVFEQCKVLTSLTFPATFKTLSTTNVFRWTPALRTVTFLGDAPKDQNGNAYKSQQQNPFGTSGGEGTGHNENLTIYYPTGNVTYADWAKWTFPKVVEGTKPPVSQTVPTSIALSAVLEQDPQGCLLLWFTVDVTHNSHPEDPALAPSGNIQYFINDTQVFPDHFMGVPTALHKITGINIKQSENDTITVQAKLLASEGFSASESTKLTGKVVMPAKDQQLPFVPGDPGDITPERQFETKPDGSGGVIITKILPPASTSPDVTFPATLDGKPVTGLGAGLFAGNVFAAYVTVPKSVKTLEVGAFKDCPHLRIITLPTGITALPEDTFSGCTDLGSVNIPNTVTTIGTNAFKNCTKLDVMTFPASVAVLDKDALSGCDLKAAVFEGNAPTFTGGVPNAFGPEIILYTEKEATGFTESPWKEMRREPVALGLDFDAKYFPSTKSMLVTVKFDTAAYGPDAPMPDINKVVVRINNFPITDNVTVNADKTISVSVPSEYDGQDAFVNIQYPGDWYYREVISESKSEILPYVKQDLTVTGATASQAAVNSNKTITLTVAPKFTETVYKPKLAKLAVTLNSTPVTAFTVDEKGGSLSMDVTALAGTTAALTLSYPGDYHLNPSNAYTVNVPIPPIPGDPPPAPAVTLTATAGSVFKTGEGCFLPVTATLTVTNPGNGAIDRTKLTVTLAGKEADKTVGVGDIFNVAIPADLLGKTVPVAVSYAGQPEYGYPGKSISLGAIKLADPNPPKADTALTATENGFVWVMASPGEVLGHALSLKNVELTHAPYTGDSSLEPDYAAITVTLDGKTPGVLHDKSGGRLTVQLNSELYGKTVSVVLKYPGDEHFNPTTRTVSGILIKPPFTLDKSAVTLTGEAKTQTLTPAFASVDAMSKAVTWKSSAESVATVNNAGVITAVANGSATITATHSGSTWSQTCSVTVKLTADPTPPPTGDGGGGGGAPAPKPEAGSDAKVTVSDKAVTEAVKTAAESGSVILKADAPADAKSVAVTVPASVMKAVAKAEAPVSLQTPVADLKLDVKVLETLQANGAKDVVVSAGAADSTALPKAAQEALAGRPIYDISITAGGKSVSQFGGGTVTVALPYTPAPGEDSSALVACWVKEDGTTEVLRSSSYKDGKLTFSTPHLSTYAIVHKDISFVDVAGDNWAKADISFAASRGILNGMGDNLFGPGIALTGSMAVAALARMDGVQDGAPGADWAAPALAWAEEKGLLPEGFSPDAMMTREQFAYLVAGFMGDAEKVNGPGYVDVTQISLPCLDSVNYLTAMGIMQGTGDGYFSPQLFLTRSELAAILHRLVDLQIG